MAMECLRQRLLFCRTDIWMWGVLQRRLIVVAAAAVVSCEANAAELTIVIASETPSSIFSSHHAAHADGSRIT